MRSIPILVLALGIAVCQLAAGPIAVAAATDSPPGRMTPPTDCRAVAPRTLDGAASQPAGPPCRQADLAPPIVRRNPGFWASNDAPPKPGQNAAADPQVTVLDAADAPAPGGAAACTSYPLPVVVGGQSLQATIVACPQANGNWQVTQYTPGLPPQIYTVPAPPAGGRRRLSGRLRLSRLLSGLGPGLGWRPLVLGVCPGNRRGAKI
jgi:hypothetical protein